MIFDTHCHYNLDPLKADWKTHWKTAQDHGVTSAVVVGTDHESSRLACAIAEQTPGLFSSVGTHPETYHELVVDWLNSSWNSETDLDTVVAKDIEQSRQLLTNASVVAIGEVGLDYFRLPKDSKERSLTIALQQEAVSAYISLAQEFELPLIFHVRDKETSAYFDLLEILRKQLNGSEHFVLHCISGPPEYLKDALELGAYIGVAANVTYATAAAIRESVAMTPPDKVLTETDAPFLPPQAYRGKTCEPWMISQTGQYITEHFKLTPEQCYQNALAFYNLEMPQ